MKTLTMKDVNLKANSKVTEIYPIRPEGDKSTVGIKLTSKEAMDLAKMLIVGASDWDVLRVTAFRGSGTVSVTSQDNWNGGDD